MTWAWRRLPALGRAAETPPGRIGRRLGDWVGRPWEQRATQTYVTAISATSLWTNNAHPQLVRAALQHASTNLEGMTRRPFTVLVSSPFWLESLSLAPYVGFVAVAVLVLAPIERRLGTGRWLAAFAAGHVGATLLSAAGLWVAVGAGWIDRSVVHAVDVGWSYGTLAVAAAGTFSLPDDRRKLWVAGVVGAAAIMVGTNPTFTDVGHVLALAIGFAMGPKLTAGLSGPASPGRKGQRGAGSESGTAPDDAAGLGLESGSTRAGGA